jgi:hypothetical protein
MAMTQDKLLDKLGKIKRMAEGAAAIGNEAEAQAFAAMLQKLLLDHKLQMTDIEYANEMKEEPIIEHRPDMTFSGRRRVYKDFPDVEIVNQRREWVEMLASIVANAYSCKILVTPGTSIITFVGHKSNVAICEFLFLTMLRSADKMSTNAAKKFRAEQRRNNGGPGNTQKGFRESWLHGFCSRISQRLQEARAADYTGSMALVRVNKEALAVNDYMSKFKKIAAPGKGLGHFNVNGYEAGKRAANDINIKGNAVNSGPNQQYLN